MITAFVMKELNRYVILHVHCGKTEQPNMVEVARLVWLSQQTTIFQNSSPPKRSAYFYITITRSLELFLTFDFKITFLNNGNFSNNLEYRFLVESTIYIATISYKTDHTKANVKTNCGVQTWLTTKNVQKSNKSIGTSYILLLLCGNCPNLNIHIFCKHLSFLWGCVSLLIFYNGYHSYYFFD